MSSPLSPSHLPAKAARGPRFFIISSDINHSRYDELDRQIFFNGMEILTDSYKGRKATP
jgi:hypothetical protein